MRRLHLRPSPEARRALPPWASSVAVPPEWHFRVHELAGTVSVLLETPDGQTAVVYLDHRTGEQVLDVTSGTEARRLHSTAHRLIQGLVDSGGTFEPLTESAFDQDDLQTWSPMQILALRTGATWDLRESLGGSPSWTQRVNDAIRSRWESAS